MVRLSALRTGRLYSPGNTPDTHFCYRLSGPQFYIAIERNLCQWKIPMTLTGIEPATLRFGAQLLNHCATAGHPLLCKILCLEFGKTTWFSFWKYLNLSFPSAAFEPRSMSKELLHWLQKKGGRHFSSDVRERVKEKAIIFLQFENFHYSL